MTDRNTRDNDAPHVPPYAGKISDLSSDDKPREKALTHGIRSLSDAELLAIILGSGLPGKSVIDLSREMLAYCNNDLTLLARMGIMEMKRQFKGVGEAKAISVSAALELATRMRSLESKQKSLRVTDSSVAYEYVRSYVANLPTEEFWIIALSRANVIRRAVCISRGGTAATYVETKLVLKTALDHLAAGVILVHNHPSGNLTPSSDDDRLTRRLKDACALLDIRVLDHLIITADSYYSYSDNGRL